jgi:predicted glycosyltransferase involved in capsule biosynthesis
MQAVYHTTIDELTPTFFEFLKKQFKNAKIDIFINEMDETDYLNKSIKNRELLEKAIKEVENGNLINKSLKELNL